MSHSDSTHSDTKLSNYYIIDPWFIPKAQRYNWLILACGDYEGREQVSSSLLLRILLSMHL